MRTAELVAPHRVPAAGWPACSAYASQDRRWRAGPSFDAKDNVGQAAKTRICPRWVTEDANGMMYLDTHSDHGLVEEHEIHHGLIRTYYGIS